MNIGSPMELQKGKTTKSHSAVETNRVESGTLSLLREHASQQQVLGANTEYLLETDSSERETRALSLKGLQDQTQAWNIWTTEFQFLKILTDS